jgi:hypothetical protein
VAPDELWGFTPGVVSEIVIGSGAMYVPPDGLKISAPLGRDGSDDKISLVQGSE